MTPAASESVRTAKDHDEARRARLSRTTWLGAVVFLCGLWLAGCVDCGALRTWQGGERESPSNSVMSLRFHLCAEDWAVASAAIGPGSEYLQARGGDPTSESFWKVASPVAREGTLPFPLGPEDAIGEAQQVGAETLVEIRHARRYEKDPRPRALVLEEQNGLWLIVGFRNW